MEFIKKLGKGLEKFVLRDILQFAKNRFKEKSSMVAILVGVGSSIGYDLNPELASAIVDGIMLASGVETTLTTAAIVQGVVLSSIGTFLAPTSKIKLKKK